VPTITIFYSHGIASLEFSSVIISEDWCSVWYKLGVVMPGLPGPPAGPAGVG
jgi:hypothetical protein